jgi:hypothetical protein
VRVRAFLAWAQRGRLIPPLEASAGHTLSAARPSDTEQRLDILQRLFSEESLDPRDRVAGALVILLAQPITRLMRLTPADVHTDRDVVYLQLGRDPIDLPEPLGRLTAELAAHPRGLATTAPAGRAPWLFPGLRLDAPLHAEHMRRRLALLGITARPDRTGAGRPLPARPARDPGRHARHLRAQRRTVGQALRRRMGPLRRRMEAQHADANKPAQIKLTLLDETADFHDTR